MENFSQSQFKDKNNQFEQLKNFQQIIQKLVENQPELFNKEEINTSLQAIDNLLDTNQKQATEIENNRQLLFTYQAQTQGLHTKLSRHKPRRLSLESGETSFVGGIMSPRKGSARSDYDNPFSPFLSPHTPNSARSTSPTIPELDTISNLVEQREQELTENAEEVIAELQTKEENLHQQVNKLTNKLAQKEEYIKFLLIHKADQDNKVAKLEQASLKNIGLQANLTRLAEDHQKLKAEAEETGTDFLLETKKNEELKKEIQEVRQSNVKLENRLEHEINEKYRLEESSKNTYAILLAKYNDIARVKEQGEKEKEDLANLIQQREREYQEERQQREIIFQKQFENVRKFQINESQRTESTKSKH